MPASFKRTFTVTVDRHYPTDRAVVTVTEQGGAYETMRTEHVSASSGERCWLRLPADVTDTALALATQGRANALDSLRAGGV